MFGNSALFLWYDFKISITQGALVLNSIDWNIFNDLISDNPLVRVLIAIWIGLILHMTLRIVIGVLVDRSVGRRHHLNPVDADKQKQTLKSVLSTMSAVILWIIIVFVIITLLGVNIAALLTGAGLFGVIFGFGAQSIIRDFVSGMFIIGENQYRVGDIVDIITPSGIVSGVVEDLTIRITRLRDLDGNLHVVSNGLAQSVTNYSYRYANVNVDIRVAYNSDIDKVEKVINEIGEAMAKDDQWKDIISEPIAFLRVDKFEDFGIVVKVLGEVQPAHQWEVAGDFRRRVITAFAKHKIQIPLPQLELNELKHNKRG
jgi:moderate conductance mechanosensitive channel